MDQIISRETLEKLVSILARDVKYASIVRGPIQGSEELMTTILENDTLNEIHDIIYYNTYNFEISQHVPFENSTTKDLLLLIIENAAQRNEMNTMKEDIKTLNEKLAVLIDALSTIGTKN